MREHTDAFLLVTSGWFNPSAIQGITRGGADEFLAHPFNFRELIEVVERAHKRWVEKRQRELQPAGAATAANEHKARAEAIKPIAPEARNARRSRTVLLGDDQFAGVVEDVLKINLEDVCELTFARFRTELELRQLMDSGSWDLVFLYVGNISWNCDVPDRRKGISFDALKSRLGDAIGILGELSARHRVPVIAIQGTDFRAEADHAGITFLQAPFKIADLMPSLHAALGIKPSVELP